MARTSSTNIALGFHAPDFNLPDMTKGGMLSLSDLKSETATVLIFMCNHCPYVMHVLQGILELVRDYQSKGVQFAGINANDVLNYPDDSPENMRALAESKKFSFPYLFDESQEVAKAYDAACTPEFHIFDKNLKCVYRGQLDDSRPGNDHEVTGRDVRKALDAIIKGKEVDQNQIPAIGCNIKWKS